MEITEDGTIKNGGVRWVHKSRIYADDDSCHSYVATGWGNGEDYDWDWNCRHLHKTEDAALACLDRYEKKYDFAETLICTFRGKKGERPDSGLLNREGKIQFSIAELSLE